MITIVFFFTFLCIALRWHSAICFRYKPCSLISQKTLNFGVSPILFPYLRPPQCRTSLHGIPKLFKWLLDLYPISVEGLKDESHAQGMMIDNFYLDMNGIIHQCTHANNDGLVHLNEQQMFLRIFKYTDQLYKMIRPKNLMYLAVDGVAPRAKMNQQRGRRFRAAKDREFLISQQNKENQRKSTLHSSFDSNCITPGTDFMQRLAVAFQLWLDYQMQNDPFWQKGATVIFSGPDVPGEGEHKIMEKIRYDQLHNVSQNAVPLKHCMYGLDADLIMLGLVTHEKHFVLLRETMNARKESAYSMLAKDFEILELSTLRKMLKLHFKETIEGIATNLAKNDMLHLQQFPLSLDRFYGYFSTSSCFFIGNDFLPGLPHVDIADGAIILLMDVYCHVLLKSGGYLTEKHQLHLPRIELFLQMLSRKEPLYFEQRAIDEGEEHYATANYKDYYYLAKFGILPSDLESKRLVVKKYLEGLAWILSYYHRGCISWTWFYPYLYAPLASDICQLGDFNLTFEPGKPFTPLLQLLSVLPPQSSQFLPKEYESLMVEPSSPLAKYFPQDFDVDLNGKKRSWESIPQIPFIDESVLLQTVSTIDHATLSKKERFRNRFGFEKCFSPVQVEV